jgi:hypothetical protein
MKMKLRLTLLVLFIAALVVSIGPLTTALQASHQNKFELVGTATSAKDPTDPSNYVIKVDNTTGFGGVRRDLDGKITALDDHLTVRYYFVGPFKNCGLGSPRIQLAIDTDNDGVSNGNAFGTIGPSPAFTGCQQNKWVTEDLTISSLEGGQAHGRWDASQLGCPNFVAWDVIKLCIATVYPNHQVLRATLIEDQATPFPGGVSYYDDITLGYRTLEDASDVSGNN